MPQQFECNECSNTNSDSGGSVAHRALPPAVNHTRAHTPAVCRHVNELLQYTSTQAHTHKHAHTHTHTFNGPFSGTTQVSRYQKGKTNLDFTEARDSEWQWNLLDHMQVCTSLQTDKHASTPPLSFFTGRMPFLSPNQQCQSTEGKSQPLSYIFYGVSLASISCR